MEHPKRILSDNGLEFQNGEMRKLTDWFQIDMLSTAGERPWSNGVCERGLGKVKGEEDLSRHMVMMWTVAAKNGLGMREGFTPNQLVFGRNPILPNLIGKNTSNSLERGGLLEGYIECDTQSKSGIYTNGE